MDLLSALTERPVIPSGSKRESGDITEDSEAASSSQSVPSSEYAVGLWLTTPTTHRTDADDFMVLMTEAFLPNASGLEDKDRAIETKPIVLPPNARPAGAVGRRPMWLMR